VLILFVAAIMWQAKKGGQDQDIGLAFGAVNFVVVGIAAYCTLLAIAGLLVFLEVTRIPNSWFVYVSCAFVAAVISGAGWNLDIWKESR
jgi:high-affinity Fe2+/Pb2+ permease